ncbi:MAG: hypothetical protein JXA79_08930 [Deltaproteobacteria bacterium]|nr:hypothetical protein [Deltaproteobacteria bacterium]
MIEETQETNETKYPNSDNNTEVAFEDEREKSKKQSEIDENPDLEDPRLYSPLQEPDRPNPTERIHEEESEPEKTEQSSQKERDEESRE